jgi:plastocyanin
MGLRRSSFLIVCALLGAAVAVLPAVAGSETGPQTITAINTEGGIYKEQHHYWSPSTAMLGPGAVLTFSNPSSEVKHGVEWTAGPAAPSCSGVPGAAGATSWNGQCVFAQPGTYMFRCTVHPTEMTGSVTVNAGGTTTTTQTTSPAPTPSTPTASAEPLMGGSPLAGGASQALRLAASQHGKAVRGSVKVSQAGAGGRLEVDLLARRASLAGTRRAPQALVGRLVRLAVAPGTVSFKVSLSGRARRALRAHRRLALTVRILLSAPHGSTASISRNVVMHP